MAETAKEITNIQQVEISDNDLNDILGAPGTDSVLLPEEGQKPSIFNRTNTVDLTFINKKETKAPATKPAETAAPATATTNVAAPTKEETITPALSEILDEIDGEKPATEDNEGATTGRPKVVKDGAIELTKKLIERGLIVPFDDEKSVDDYSVKDIEELLEANITDRENRIKEKTPIEFFDSLPEELQYAAKYHADGGTDMKALFQALAQVEETRTLDPEKPEDHEVIVKEYLKATNFGTVEEINEEIDSLKDLNKLADRATKFKPKLDKMSESRVAQKLAYQENLRRQQSEASSTYMNNVYETLKPSELNGIKLDKKTQGMLYSGLVQPNYPSISGKQTNLLGHLLEKYQFVEPNHGLIAEALWLLADPEGYKAKVKDIGKNAQVEETVRKLKTEESKKISSSPVIEKDEQKVRTVKRNDGFFKR